MVPADRSQTDVDAGARAGGGAMPLLLRPFAPAADRIADALRSMRRIVARGAAGSSTNLLAGAVARTTGRPVLLVVAHLDDADESHDEVAGQGLKAWRLPALEALPGEPGVGLDQVAERLSALGAIQSGDRPEVMVAPIQSLMQLVPPAAKLPALIRTLRVGEDVALTGLTQWLVSAGYVRVEAIEEAGQFAVRGGILDVFPPGLPGEARGALTGIPVRLDFFGDTIEKILEVDLETQGSDRAATAIELVAANPEMLKPTSDFISVLDVIPRDAIVMLAETMEIVEQARGYFERVLEQRGIEGPPAVFARFEKRQSGEGGGVGGGGGAGALVEVNQFSAIAAKAQAIIEVPVSPLPSFAHDVMDALAELAQLTDANVEENGESEVGASEVGKSEAGASEVGANSSASPARTPTPTRVMVCCQNRGETQRFAELLAQASAPRSPSQRALESAATDEEKQALARDMMVPSISREAAARIEGVTAYLHRGVIIHPPSSSAAGVANTETNTESNTESLAESIALVPYHELLNRFTVRRRAGRLRGGRAMDTFLDFQPGDYVVHQDHGVSRFVGLTLMKPRELPSPLLKKKAKEDDLEEYLTLEFAKNSRLHVPVTQIDMVQRYVGGFQGKPPLSALGGQKWKTQKAKAQESVRELAGEMLRVRAAREHMPGVQFPPDTAWQQEFEAEFPYDETEDQLAALAEIKRDMQSPRPMDRLICGDVGFGKTELAIRAAFKACEYGKQVAVLVPTTVLAEQHERTFKARFADYPFRVESLSRFKTGSESNQILAALRKGHVDVIIGTHRILSNDVRFADLGLVVVDEEQRFGVEHKEALLRLRMTVDVMTLSATPIPRTLHMAMLGLRDISSLTTAPVDRRAVVTEVIPYNARRIEQAIKRELAREGQVFFVHNRVVDLQDIATKIKSLVPDARIVTGHGQMEGHELEAAMLKFIRREADILVSTTIIESGIDIASANTMFINNADHFGLADLHQLRGRVGRSKNRAYCYLLLDPEKAQKETARKRLLAIEQYSMLGAGFKIAMRDLEIRGAGNILGAEQSGHIANVGYELYCRLLDEAVHALKHEKPITRSSSSSVEIGISGLIPKGYVPSELRRLEAYRRIASSSTLAHLEQVREDMTSAYGQMPRPVMRLLDLAQVRITLAELGTRTVTVRERDVVFLSHEPGALVDRLRHGVSGQPLTSVAADATIRVLEPKSEGLPHEIYFRPPESYFEPESLLRVLRQRLVPKPAGEEAPPPGAKPEPKSKSKSKAGLSPSSGPGPARDPAARSQLGSPSRPASDRNRRRPG
jgi:transcription-repair coupling factor (superfamily II helicase)